MTEHFVSHHQARGSPSKDWSASWRTWVLRDIKFCGDPRERRPHSRPNEAIAACDDLISHFGGGSYSSPGLGSDGAAIIIEHADPDTIPF